MFGVTNRKAPCIANTDERSGTCAEDGRVQVVERDSGKAWAGDCEMDFR